MGGGERGIEGRAGKGLIFNSPFPSCSKPLFQTEAKCKMHYYENDFLFSCKSFCYWFPESCPQSQLPFKKWPLFTNFQVQRDSPSAT